MHHIILASSNRHKIEEMEAVSGGKLSIKTAFEVGITEEIPETGKTLAENARLKARYVFERTGEEVFSDDSGLEVTALGGAPGVYSARYAGPEKDSDKNMDLLLERLKDAEDRSACFKTVICYIKDGIEYMFEGRVEGEIIHEKRGSKGFGYDPIFRPYGSDRTFAEMDEIAKNAMSHRSRALAKLLIFLDL